MGEKLPTIEEKGWSSREVAFKGHVCEKCLMLGNEEGDCDQEDMTVSLDQVRKCLHRFDHDAERLMKKKTGDVEPGFILFLNSMEDWEL